MEGWLPTEQPNFNASSIVLILIVITYVTFYRKTLLYCNIYYVSKNLGRLPRFGEVSWLSKHPSPYHVLVNVVTRRREVALILRDIVA